MKQQTWVPTNQSNNHSKRYSGKFIKTQTAANNQHTNTQTIADRLKVYAAKSTALKYPVHHQPNAHLHNTIYGSHNFNANSPPSQPSKERLHIPDMLNMQNQAITIQTSL
eukprot:gene2993-1975_t